MTTRGRRGQEAENIEGLEIEVEGKWHKQNAKVQRKYEGKKPKECGNTKVFMLESEEKKMEEKDPERV